MLVCSFLDAAETWTVSDILQFTAAEEDGAVSEQCHDLPLPLGDRGFHYTIFTAFLDEFFL